VPPHQIPPLPSRYGRLGAIAGLLLAPRSGEETRKYLRERSNKGLDTLNQQAGKLRDISFQDCPVLDSNRSRVGVS